MADLILSVDYNITAAEAKQRKLNRELELSKQKAKNINDEIKNTNNSIDESNRKIKEQIKEYENVKSKITDVEQHRIYMSDKNYNKLKSQSEKILDGIEKEENARAKLNEKVAKQTIQLQAQNDKTISLGEKLSVNSQKQNKFLDVLQKTNKSVDKIGSRIKGLFLSVLIFSAITRTFRKMQQAFSNMLNEAGSKSAKLLNELKSNLAVLGRTIAESIRPQIEWLLQKLVEITKVLTLGIAKVLGKSVSEMQKLTKATKKAGQEAKNTTAGFDNIQIIGDNSSAGADSGFDFSALNSPITEEMGILTAIVSSAALVLGVLLAFSGVNIKLGLALIAAGAIGLVSTYAVTWGIMTEQTKQEITGIMSLGGGLMILLGLALILTGAGIPLGIGLILLGASSLYGAVKLSPGDNFIEKVKNLWAATKEITQSFLSWWNTNVIEKIFGTGMSKTLQNTFDAFIHFFEDLIYFFHHVVEGDWKNAGKSLANIIIDMLNLALSSISQTLQFIFGGGSKLINKLGELMGKDWDLSASWAKFPKIPRLATGAILPGGSPSLAIVNDQPKGQGYVEGSIDNIAAAFEKYLGNNTREEKYIVEARGPMAPFLKMLNLELHKEDSRSSAWAEG